jgi:hypothetical protein
MLEAHGLAIGDRPLGPCPGATARGAISVPPFNQGWPLRLTGAVPGRDVLVEAFGEAVVVKVEIGAGRWVWISDSRFFWNANLKLGTDGISQPAIDFLAAFVGAGD